MFEILLVKKEDIKSAEEYLGCETMGIIMACYESGKIIGAVCFDIIDGMGYIQKVKTDDPSMKRVVGTAALNFLEFHHIMEVYVTDFSDREYYRSLGFCETQQHQEMIAGEYKGVLSLENYFTAH